MTTSDIHEGKRLAMGETIVWRGTPSWTSLARHALHLRGVVAYLGLLVALDAYHALAKAIPLAKALHDSIPLAVIIAIVLINVVGLAFLLGRTTRYTITDRRVILDYGVAMPATLSLPYSRLQSVSLSIKGDHGGDIALGLKEGEHMPFLKLWPHARPWHLVNPQPMLRGVPRAAVVAGLLTRAVTKAAQTQAELDQSHDKIKTLAA